MQADAQAACRTSTMCKIEGDARAKATCMAVQITITTSLSERRQSSARSRICKGLLSKIDCAAAALLTCRRVRHDGRVAAGCHTQSTWFSFGFASRKAPSFATIKGTSTRKAVQHDRKSSRFQDEAEKQGRIGEGPGLITARVSSTAPCF